MSSRQARFEVVHTGPSQWHARFRAANGQIVWTTESYKRRRAAWAAVRTFENAVNASGEPLELREVDEPTGTVWAGATLTLRRDDGGNR